VESSIYPSLSAGFTDDNAYIRELTLKAVLTLAPKLKQVGVGVCVWGGGGLGLRRRAGESWSDWLSVGNG
jgi:hypothetical protein